MNGKKIVSQGWGCGERGRRLSPLSPPISDEEIKVWFFTTELRPEPGSRVLDNSNPHPRGGRSVRGSPVKGKD